MIRVVNGKYVNVPDPPPPTLEDIAAGLLLDKDGLKNQLEFSAEEATERHASSRPHRLREEALLLKRATQWTADGYPNPAPPILKSYNPAASTKPDYIISAEEIIQNASDLESKLSEISRIRRKRRRSIDDSADLTAAQLELIVGIAELITI